VDNEAKITMYNFAKEKAGGRLPNIGDVMYKEYAGKHQINMFEELVECIRSGDQKKFLDLKYEERFLNIMISPFSGGAIITSIDITERKQTEEQIKASLKEKEVLLQEIHHRVKNNMQIISSLLKLQASGVGDERLTDALMECRGRVQTMAFVHETLYGSDTLTVIDFKTYISKLANQIFQSYGTSKDRVKLEVDAEDIKLGIEQATPLGLIVNELVSNSLKHAFPQDRTRQIKLWEPPGSAKRLPMIISINLRSINENEFELKVSDSGIGILEDLDWQNTDSLGLRLVIILTDQLDGTVSLDRREGTHFTVRFRHEENQ
jgi:two-component sensor histidine kinase